VGWVSGTQEYPIVHKGIVYKQLFCTPSSDYYDKLPGFTLRKSSVANVPSNLRICVIEQSPMKVISKYYRDGIDTIKNIGSSILHMNLRSVWQWLYSLTKEDYSW